MVVRRQCVNFTPQPLRDVGEQRVSTCDEDVLEEITTDRLLAFHDRVINVLLNTLACDVTALRQVRLEKDLRAAETLLAEDHLLAIWEHEILLTRFRLRSLLEGVVEIFNTVGHRFFHDAKLGDLSRRSKSLLGHRV